MKLVFISDKSVLLPSLICKELKERIAHFLQAIGSNHERISHVELLLRATRVFCSRHSFAKSDKRDSLTVALF